MRSKGGVGGGRDRGLGGKMLLLSPCESVGTEVESRVAAVVWLAHGGSLIRAAPEHLVACSPLDTTLVETANPDSALPGASRLRDLRNLRRTEYADLGSPPTESERLDAWQDPDGREPQQFGHLFPPSSDSDVVTAPPTPESQLPPHPVSIPVSFALRVNVVRPRDSSGRLLPRSGSRDHTPDESADSPRMQNEPGSSSRDGQQIHVDPSDHVVIPGDSGVPREGFGIEGNDDNPHFQRVPDRVSDEHPLLNLNCNHLNLLRHVHESPLNSLKKCACETVKLQSTVSSSEAALAFSASSLEPVFFVNKTMEKRLVLN